MRGRRVAGLVLTAAVALLTVPQAAYADDGAAAAPTPSSEAVPVLRSAGPGGGETVDRTRVRLRGADLAGVRAVLLGGRVLPGLRHVSATELTVVVPTAPRFLAAEEPFVLRTPAGDRRSEVRWRWTASSARARELRWVQSHAGSRSYAWGHRYIPFEDCANFAGHALAVRGLPSAVLQVSSTALRSVLVGRFHEREVADSAAARRRVRVGDLVQFDWWPSRARPGDRDHTGVVTAVEDDGHGGTVVRYTAHTDPGDAPQVDTTVERSLREPGHDPRGRVFFLLIG